MSTLLVAHRHVRGPRGTGRSAIGRSAVGRSLSLRLVLALGVLLALAAPVSGASGPTRLSDAAVSPRSGTTQTTVTFEVAYRNREGSPADYVRVRVGGQAHAMSRAGGDDWKRDVRFSWSGTLPAGDHAVIFEAMSRDRFDDTLAAGSVTITVPATPSPTPKPTPKPTPEPTATPTPTPTRAPTPKPTNTPGPTTDPTPRPTGTPVPTPPSTPEPTPTASPGTGTPQPTPSTTAAPTVEPGTPGTGRPPASATPAGTPGGSGSPGAPTPAPSDDAEAGVVPGTFGSIPGDPGGGQGPGAGGSGSGSPRAGGGAGTGGRTPGTPLDAVTSAIGTTMFGQPHLPFGLLLTMTTTTTVVGAALAFSVFGKRRRDGEQPAPDEVLAQAAATGVGLPGGTAAAPTPASTDPLVMELAMPRWRRPSLLEARKADPVRDATPAPRLTFDHGLVGALDGRERRLIHYNVVRLLDRPDEIRAAEIGFLDSGDEVQLLERRGVYWLVLCPDGRQGWIHKMTLGEVVEEAAGQAAATATMPIDAETWTLGEDVDGDVLAAYLESRRRA